ncbi:MAG: pyrroline-5-carboxylate reductase [Leifsonia sp.]
MSTELPAIAFLGAGSMAGAIIQGLLAPGVTVVGGIRATNRSAAKAAELSALDGVTAGSTELDPDANRVAVRGARIVVVAVKPAMVPDLLREIADAIEPGTIVVSVAAGVTIATFESLLPDGVAVIRSMPNTPAVVGRGVTGIAAGTRSSAEDLALAVAMFETVGSVLVVPEEQIDALSTISGSGPAYVFYLIEQLTAAAVQKGFTPEQAALLVNGTFLGASEYLVASGETPQELRRRVTSPNGTTERAIRVFEEADLGPVFVAATDAALARAKELAAGA